MTTCITKHPDHVSVVFQNTIVLGYEAVYDDRVSVQAVLDDFAKRFSLPAKLCTAWHLQTRLKGKEVLLEVWSQLCCMLGRSVKTGPSVNHLLLLCTCRWHAPSTYQL